MYSDSAEQFLRRKLVRRDLIFSYLADQDIAVSPGSDKSRLIQKVLQYWQSPDCANGMYKETETDDSPSSSQEYNESSQEMFRLSQESEKSSSQAASPNDVDQSSWCQELAVQFSSWFFTQLNNLHPHCPAPSTSEWGPSHFLADASLKLCVLRGTDRQLDAFDGSDMVAARLGCLVSEEELRFNPNLSQEGTRGCSEPHGLVIIAVCGTIHKSGTCIGLFELNFGLVKDPVANNNWKIKFINMQIKDGSSPNVPTLGQVNKLEMITT